MFNGIISCNSSVLHVQQHLGNAHSQQCLHLLLYFLQCQKQVSSNRHTLQHTYLRIDSSGYLCESTHVHRGNDQYLLSLITCMLCTCQYVRIMSILHMYYVHITTAQEILKKHCPVFQFPIIQYLKFQNPYILS